MVPPRPTCKVHDEMLVDMAATIGDLLIERKKTNDTNDMVVSALVTKLEASTRRLRCASDAARTITTAINALPSNAVLHAQYTSNELVQIIDGFAAGVEDAVNDLSQHLELNTGVEATRRSPLPTYDRCKVCGARGEAAGIGSSDMLPTLASSVDQGGSRYTAVHLVTFERLVDGVESPTRFVGNALELCNDCNQAVEDTLEARAAGAESTTSDAAKPDRIGDAA